MGFSLFNVFVLTGRASGTGKTTLANTLVPIVEDDGGLFLRGKFDQHQHLTGISPCLRAFRFFAKRVLARGEEEAKKVKIAIEQAVGSEIGLLLDLIPELGELLIPEAWQEQQERSSTSGMDSSSHSEFGGGVSESQAQVVSVFRRFLDACSSRERPVVLFMDDLQVSMADGARSNVVMEMTEFLLDLFLVQWADGFSLDVLAARFFESKEESRNSGFLFLSACRGNEVSLQDRLATVLRALEDHGTKITDIQVGNLSFDAQLDMISDMLHRPREECLPLAEVVHSQTGGNALFSIQFLRSLEEDGTLYKDENMGGIWTWKTETLMVSLEKAGNDDLIVQLLANKMKELPSVVLQVLKVASCLENEFDDEVLCNSVAFPGPQVLAALDVADEKGIIVHDFNAGVGCFTHDKFKEATYSLIPEGGKASFHLQIAQSLKQQLTPKTSKKYVAVILSQVGAGIDELKEPTEREEWAYVCLKAARKAGKAASFAAAYEYVELALRLLERRNWRDQYDLSLSLYNSACELSYCTGKNYRVHELVKVIVENARSSTDKLHAHSAKITTLIAEGNSKVGIPYCIEVLRRLGQPFPKSPNMTQVLLDYMKIKRQLARFTDEDIMNLPPLKDQQMTTAIFFIHLLFPLAQQQRYEYSPLIAFRLVHLTLKHGMSPMGK
jgi:predicted ATPase